MEAPETKTAKPPYLSFTTLTNFLNGFKESGIPTRIDKSIMPGQSGSTQSYILSALEFFDLMDAKSGTPKDDLEKLVTAEGDAQKAKWKALFLRAYEPVINGLDLQRATAGQLLENFKQYNYGGDTLRKCHVFFVAVADAAGVTLANHLRIVSRVAAVRKSPKKVTGDKGGVVDDEDGAGDSGGGASLPEVAGHSIASLLLASDGSRFVKLQAPATITATELKRIQAWMGFQLIVEEGNPS